MGDIPNCRLHSEMDHILPIAEVACLELVSCKCAKSSRGNCNCFKADLEFIPLSVANVVGPAITSDASVFLSFCSPAPSSRHLHPGTFISTSLFRPRILLLFSVHAHTNSTYFPVFSWIFLPSSLSPNYFSPPW